MITWLLVRFYERFQLREQTSCLHARLVWVPFNTSDAVFKAAFTLAQISGHALEARCNCSGVMSALGHRVNANCGLFTRTNSQSLQPAQSCTRVQISRFDPTRPTKIVTRPDRNRWLSMMGKQGFIIARCTLSSAYTQATSSTRRRLLHRQSRRTPFLNTATTLSLA